MIFASCYILDLKLFHFMQVYISLNSFGFHFHKILINLPLLVTYLAVHFL